MGVRFPSVATTTFVGPFPANANETAVLTTPPLNISLDFAQIFIHAYLVMNPGTSTTNLVARLRRGSGTGGTLVSANAGTLTVTAGTNVFVAMSYVDTPGAVAGQQYTFTISQTGATVAGAAVDQCMFAFML